MDNIGENVEYTEEDDIIYYNKRLIEKDGGLLSNYALVEERLSYVVNQVQDNNVYPTLTEKAAFYAKRIVEGHYFNDGNKRTGIKTGLYFLCANGFEHQINRKVKNKDIVNIGYKIANKTISFPEIVQWFEWAIS